MCRARQQARIRDTHGSTSLRYYSLSTDRAREGERERKRNRESEGERKVGRRERVGEEVERESEKSTMTVKNRCLLLPNPSS